MNILDLIPILGKVLDRVLPDKQAAAMAQLELLKLAQEGEFNLALGQIEINKAEASNPSVFVSGWRPFIGWVGGFSLVYQFLGQPLLAWLSATKGWQIPPTLEMGDLITIVGGMLGLSGMRTAEKIKGVARAS